MVSGEFRPVRVIRFVFLHSEWGAAATGGAAPKTHDFTTHHLTFMRDVWVGFPYFGADQSL